MSAAEVFLDAGAVAVQPPAVEYEVHRVVLEIISVELAVEVAHHAALHGADVVFAQLVVDPSELFFELAVVLNELARVALEFVDEFWHELVDERVERLRLYW